MRTIEIITSITVIHNQTGQEATYSVAAEGRGRVGLDFDYDATNKMIRIRRESFGLMKSIAVLFAHSITKVKYETINLK